MRPQHAAERYEQIPACRSRFGAGRTAAEELDAAIQQNLEGLGYFAGTRVPVRILIEHLEAGDRLDNVLDDYPTVTREQAIGVLDLAMGRIPSEKANRDR